MPDQSRSLPGQPSLRYLKLEAKRRLADGEFPTLHDAQVAIAREHGQPSWAALKQVINDESEQESHALDQLRWVIARFGGAGEPEWAPPAEDELREHFDDRFLSIVPAGTLIESISGMATALHGDLAVTSATPLSVRAEIGGLEVFAAAEAGPPHRLNALQGVSLGGRITDSRAAAPPVRTLGEAPGWAAEVAEPAFGELGLVGLVLAGRGDVRHGDAGRADAGREGAAPAWVLATGWADLDRGEVLEASHRLPASGISVLVTATAVLRLVAKGSVGLDAPANDYLRTVRLADDTVTVRELLSHTGGVDSPDPGSLIADSVPDLVTVTGPVIACSGPRGEVRPSNGGAAVLGQLLADVTGSPFTEAATRLVLGPLGMNDSSFPASVAEIGLHAVTGYNVTPEGKFVPAPPKVCTLPAAGGLWATAADVLRLGSGWASLLPSALAREALASDNGEGRVGLGWFLSPRRDVAMNGGALPGSTASLLLRIRDNRLNMTITTRFVVLERIHERVLRAWANNTNNTN